MTYTKLMQLEKGISMLRDSKAIDKYFVDFFVIPKCYENGDAKHSNDGYISIGVNYGDIHEDLADALRELGWVLEEGMPCDFWKFYL